MPRNGERKGSRKGRGDKTEAAQGEGKGMEEREKNTLQQGVVKKGMGKSMADATK